jgi:D-alanyl-D-alanine carboxypeptidase/D-alanyl-D-alanine-endopeptidase (penicillin-binding protein 4)
MTRLLSLLVALTCTAFPAHAFDDPLPAPVAAALARAGLPADALAAIAVPQARWVRPWQVRADMPMQPGSTMKLVTTVVALDRLGPGRRGRTELLSSGAVADGVLTGDLILKGGADTDLDLPALWQMLFELRQRGVHTIGGELLLDRSLFRPARIDLGLLPFDESPEWPYNAIPDALMLAGNLMTLSISADDAAVSARLTPPLEGIELDASGLALTATRCADWDDDWQPPLVTPLAGEPAPGPHWRIELRGGFPRRCEAQPRLQLLDRDMLTAAQVRTVWASLGGRWLQPPSRAREAATPPDALLLARHLSRPWGEVLRGINKTSDNALTRLTFLQLGLAAAANDATTPTLELARREVERWFDEHRIDRKSLVLDNGSGLSRSERIAPRTLARLLKTALDGRYAPELLMSLPVAGEDGTMRRRLKGTPAEGWARLKTGALKNVAAVAGTVRDTRGTTWIVVAMINHDEAGSSGQAQPVLDALVEWVARSGARWRHDPRSR